MSIEAPFTSKHEANKTPITRDIIEFLTWEAMWTSVAIAATFRKPSPKADDGQASWVPNGPEVTCGVEGNRVLMLPFLLSARELFGIRPSSSLSSNRLKVFKLPLRVPASFRIIHQLVHNSTLTFCTRKIVCCWRTERCFGLDDGANLEQTLLRLNL